MAFESCRASQTGLGGTRPPSRARLFDMEGLQRCLYQLDEFHHVRDSAEKSIQIINLRFQDADGFMFRRVQGTRGSTRGLTENHTASSTWHPLESLLMVNEILPPFPENVL